MQCAATLQWLHYAPITQSRKAQQHIHIDTSTEQISNAVSSAVLVGLPVCIHLSAVFLYIAQGV